MLPLLLSLTLAAPIADKGDDHKALQGTWVVVTAEMDGKEFKDALKATMTFKDDKVTSFKRDNIPDAAPRAPDNDISIQKFPKI